jgi:hypothetical protein
MIDDPLQCALGVLFTNEAVRIVVGNQKFQGNLPRSADFGAFRSDNHSILSRGFARNGRSSPVYFHNAKPAGAHRLQIAMMTEMRNVNVLPQCRLKYGHPFVGLNRLAVDCEFDFIRHY